MAALPPVITAVIFDFNDHGQTPCNQMLDNPPRTIFNLKSIYKQTLYRELYNCLHEFFITKVLHLFGVTF